VNNSAAFVSSLAHTRQLKKNRYISQRREFPIILLHEAAEDKAHGIGDVDLVSSGGKELKCREILH
jgi:hypothetical protein